MTGPFDVSGTRVLVTGASGGPDRHFATLPARDASGRVTGSVLVVDGGQPGPSH